MQLASPAATPLARTPPALRQQHTAQRPLRLGQSSRQAPPTRQQLAHAQVADLQGRHQPVRDSLTGSQILPREGPPALRWALYEAAQCACRNDSPDNAYYQQTAARIGHKRACLAIARKLLKRSYQCVTNAEGGAARWCSRWCRAATGYGDRRSTPADRCRSAAGRVEPSLCPGPRSASGAAAQAAW